MPKRDYSSKAYGLDPGEQERLCIAIPTTTFFSRQAPDKRCLAMNQGKCIQFSLLHWFIIRPHTLLRNVWGLANSRAWPCIMKWMYVVRDMSIGRRTFPFSNVLVHLWWNKSTTDVQVSLWVRNGNAIFSGSQVIHSISNHSYIFPRSTIYEERTRSYSKLMREPQVVTFHLSLITSEKDNLKKI